MNQSWCLSTTDETFQQDVIERSKRELVVLDFWAEWCGPCRALGPVLEKLTEQAAGQFTLVKANTDQMPKTAGAYGVSSIPTLLAISAGEVIDAFQGNLHETVIGQWLSRVYTKHQLKTASQSAAADPAGAERSLRDLLAAQPRNRDVAIALIGLLWQIGKTQECAELLAQLEQEAPLEPEAQKVKASLALQAKASIDLAAARSAAQAAPKNWQAQLEFAQALIGHQAFEQAFDVCLSLVMQDRKQTGEQARALMVEVFQALPDDSPLTSEYRRKLASALY